MSELPPSPLFAGTDHLTVDAARAQIAAAIAAAHRPPALAERVALAIALGRVLAADVISPIDVPAHANSAMDGYAFDGTALGDHDTVLRCVGSVMAGTPHAGHIDAGECLRIMTGAVMPDGTDSVVPLELCRVDGDEVTIAAGVLKPGENHRRRGEDLAVGRAALLAGRRLRPADLGLAASLGIGAVTVMRKLRVALFSTGDELRDVGQPLDPGCVYDSNRSSLRAALQQLDFDVIDLGLVPDDPEILEQTLRRATDEADAVVTSGGVSMGDADHVREVLARCGSVDFWRVAMRPGRPFAFGPLYGASFPVWLFALPGNPVAALVSFYVFAREALLQLAGTRAEPLPLLTARSAEAIRKRPGRTEYQRAIVERADDGTWQARLTGSQGAGVLRSMTEANALIVLGHDQGAVKTGDALQVWLFDGLA